MEAARCSRRRARLLLAQIAVERGEQRCVGARRDRAHGFDLQRAADEHRLAAIGEIDAGDARAALRQHLDEALRREASERLRDRKARDAEPRAERGLVDRGAGRQVEPHDRVADHLLHALHGAAASLARQGGQKGVWSSCVSGPA